MHLIIIFLSLITHVASASQWQHELTENKILTDSIVSKTYKGEKEPQIHNGITTTNYFKEFDLVAEQSLQDCFTPKINKWFVQTTIFIRSKDDKAIIKGKPRWQSIKDFNCEDEGGYFNTWDGTLVHEKEHYKLRDKELQKFWKQLKKEMPNLCEKTKDAAKVKVLLAIEAFLKKIQKMDTEENPRAVERKFYELEFTKLSGKHCPAK